MRVLEDALGLIYPQRKFNVEGLVLKISSGDTDTFHNLVLAMRRKDKRTNKLTWPFPTTYLWRVSDAINMGTYISSVNKAFEGFSAGADGVSMAELLSMLAYAYGSVRFWRGGAEPWHHVGWGVRHADGC